MSSLPSDYQNEIRALDREILKHQPRDILQFSANFFHRRLESQRAEFLLGQRHSSQPGGMAESSFPGQNPFGAAGGAGSAGGGKGGMHRLDEEEEEELGSPRQRGLGEEAKGPFEKGGNSGDGGVSGGGFGGGGGGFGNFGFGAAGSSSSSRGAPPAAASAGAAGMDTSSLPSNYNVNRRTSVSAESLAPSSADDTNWRAPSYPKTAEQQSRLRAAVSHNFLFSHLDDDSSAQVLAALQERKVPAKDVRVIVQGDAGDYFYVVERGSFDIYVSSSGHVEPGPEGMGNKVASSGPGTSFGELALMYNAPRAATVVSTEPSILWQLDRVTFRRILMDSAFQRRRMYESFLEEVPLLSSLTAYERSKIADALETTKYPDNTPIIKEGDVGDRFYLLESGEAEAIKRGVNGAVKLYKKGDYFGELALLDDKPRAASVVSKGEGCKVAWLGKDGFQRLLGSVEGVLRRDDPRQTSR
nr:hypothetical protein B0A51_17435 [Rachicladosporium sp. CCFEE 5018]